MLPFFSKDIQYIAMLYGVGSVFPITFSDIGLIGYTLLINFYYMGYFTAI